MYLDVDTRSSSQAFYTFGASMIALVVAQEVNHKFPNLSARKMECHWNG
jgi:hypothetical protein